MSWGHDRWGWSRSPRRPANGLRARSQRGAFGKSWWATRWIAALERLVDAGRLARGRSYARSGQVMKLDVSSKGVSAKVQGSMPTPYRVSMRFETLTDATWDLVVGALADQAIFAAKLLAGEMPDQIEEVFESVGASLLPATKGDLETSCSCPDWANPCKHVAAVHYLLGERFDADPFLMFELRGRTKDQIVEALRSRRAGIAELDSTASASDAVAPEEEPFFDGDHDRFWSGPAEASSFGLAFSAPAAAALPVKGLGRPPFWDSPRDFDEVMEHAYRTVANQALRVVVEDGLTE